jgi:Protein of unknown function (DUF3347)
MRTSKYLLAVAVMLVASSPGAALNASESMKAIVGSYLEIHAALAADKTEGTAAAAKAIAAEATRMGPAGANISTAARSLEGAADLKAARAAFGDLSDAVIAAAKLDGFKDMPDVKIAYCPMARKSWLQKDAAIKNPYYGSSMLTCGEFKQ